MQWINLARVIRKRGVKAQLPTGFTDQLLEGNPHALGECILVNTNKHIKKRIILILYTLPEKGKHPNSF